MNKTHKLVSTNNQWYLVIVVTIGVVVAVFLLTSRPGVSPAAIGTVTQATDTMANHTSQQRADEMALQALLGKPAPDFSLESYDGKQVKLSDYKGKYVVLFFNEGIMCYPACWNQMTALANDQNLNSDQTVTLSIVVDRKQDWKTAVDKMPELALATVLFDPNRTTSQLYGVLSLTSSMHKGQLPGHTYVIVDKKGIIQYVKDDVKMGVRNTELIQALQAMQ